MRKQSMLVLGSLFVFAWASPALAREEGHRKNGRPARHAQAARPPKAAPAPSAVHSWHGDIHQFRDRDFHRWRSGQWNHGHYRGRTGWWWVVGDNWYFYSSPVHPYPDPFTPAGFAVVTDAPVYYYCSNPAGYYPYVPYCQVGWQKLVTQTATPIVITQAAPAPVVAAQPGPLSAREADYRQLNRIADDFYHIDYKKPSASTKLRELDKRLERFRQALLQREYNAMNVIRDVEDLKGRISHQRRCLAMGDTTPPSLPTGTRVAFPVQ